MRILSTRVSHARHDRATNRVDAIVTLLIRDAAGLGDYQVQVRTSAPAHAPGAAALRDRLAASAKLIFATRPDTGRAQSFAA
ncbi:MAG: hypothetical protein OEY05_13395 [Paracoccaceae bacterium]|nr:hypothetical protein [Paracoccaceae bacterium]